MNPRSYSPSPEFELVTHCERPLSPSNAHQKMIKRAGPGRRYSRQDIEAFYQEGKRLQEEELARDHHSDHSGDIAQDEIIGMLKTRITG